MTTEIPGKVLPWGEMEAQVICEKRFWMCETCRPVAIGETLPSLFACLRAGRLLIASGAHDPPLFRPSKTLRTRAFRGRQTVFRSCVIHVTIFRFGLSCCTL